MIEHEAREDESESLVDIGTVAKRLGCSRMTVYRLIAAGKLPTVQFGERRRVRESTLRAYIDDLPAINAHRGSA